MKKQSRRIIILLIISLIIGNAITLITGFFPVFTGILGVQRWGFPFYWLSQTVSLGAERMINWSNLFINILIWSFLSILLLLLFRFLISTFNTGKDTK